MVANLLAAIGDDDQYVLYRLHTERNTEIERERDCNTEFCLQRRWGLEREEEKEREREMGLVIQE